MSIKGIDSARLGGACLWYLAPGTLAPEAGGLKALSKAI